ncbi:uncharacterized protein LOC129316520 [Prosopis cineraria]|uniref:uncharacterized protein LOC129316520 n=1 Tax=Prosopis cineraria TaxID=364024 RepID=UPI00240F0B1D|nr:uncharacterized protein LOC129316520 [Prosopis cineraria]
MAKLAKSQIKNNQEQATINVRVDSSLKNLEVQMGKIATVVTTLYKGGLLSNTKTNHRREGNEECKAITLWSRKQLFEISPPTSKSILKLEIDQTEQEISKEGIRGAIQEIIRNLQAIAHINIPLIEALEKIPQHAKFLKKILSKKRRLSECETVALTEEYNAILLNKLAPKCHDPGSFSIPYVIGDKFQGGALCDLGLSINLMPVSIFRKLQLGEASSTSVTLQLSYKSLAFSKGKIEDVLVKVDEFIFPIDFIVLDYDEDRNLPLIVGTSFLATA